MRFPKTVQISGKKYNVYQDKNAWGGSIKTGEQRIVIGTKSNQSASRKFDNYLHEVMEGVACERNLRYTASDEEHVLVMTHRQFDEFVVDVAAAIRPMLK